MGPALVSLCRFSLFALAIAARIVAVVAAELSSGCRWVLEETKRNSQPIAAQNLPVIDLREKN